ERDRLSCACLTIENEKALFAISVAMRADVIGVQTPEKTHFRVHILAVPDGDTKTCARGHPLYAYAFTASQFFNLCPKRNTFSPADVCTACPIRRAKGRLQRHTLSHCTNHRLNLLYGAMSAATIAGNSALAPNETGVRF